MISNLQFAQDKFLKLVNNTGYTLIQRNGQRIYSKPTENMNLPKGCEIFIGKLPKDMYEDEIVPLFQRFGQIHKVRLMLDFNGKGRGFGFVSYYDVDIANYVVNYMNNFEIRPGHHIGVYKSVDNCR